MSSEFDHLPVLHTRTYDAVSYRNGDQIKVVGTVEDVKPAGLYVQDDPDPLPIHHMQIVLDVDIETLSIVDARVEFFVHPNDTCPSITQHYEKLIGLSITRGFNRSVRELFGGPKACTHTTALLQAMAPVVIQSLWSVRTLDKRDQGQDPFDRDPQALEQTIAANLNTCHVWAADGEMVHRAQRGEWGEAPVWIKTRFAELGRPLAEWAPGA